MTLVRAFLSTTPTPHALCAVFYLVPMLIGAAIGAWNPML